MGRPKLEDMTFAFFGGKACLIGYRDCLPILGVDFIEKFDNTYLTKKEMRKWSTKSLLDVSKYNTEVYEWVLKNWNNLDFSTEPQIYRE